TQQLVVAALREALASSDGAVRRDAVEAIGRARVAELVPDVRSLIRQGTDIELRLVATKSAATLRDDAAAPVLEEPLQRDLINDSRLAVADMQALIEIGRSSTAAAYVAQQIAANPSNTVAIQVLALAPAEDLASFLPRWLASRQSRVRAAACTALAGYP